MNDRVFITGATGFVGANLVRLLLEQGCSVRALVRPHSDLSNLAGLPIETVTGSLTDPDLAKTMDGCRYCFHVAALYSLWQRDRPQLYQANVLGTRNVLAAAQQAGIERTVYTSSVAAIGVRSDGQLADETHQSPPEKLISDYKKSKYWAEQEAVKAAYAGQSVVIVNPSTPIGPRDLKPTPTGGIILRFLRRQMPAYVDTGLNLIDVQDVAWGHWLALHHGKVATESKNGEVNRYILGHQNTSLKQLLELLGEITGLPAPKTTVPLWLPLGVAWTEERLLAKLGYQPTVPLDGVRMSSQSMYYDTSKAVRELGLPQSPIREAVVEAVTWFRSAGMV
ncbi:MAG: NAD-dependent epimerase/dehydratase family protein [Synechococcales cyanobacterium CRU_2_2]|nr:NAD-dependent epimerase/dehydratase family protein [Synechococcales cyanobacterium CRU_2_2]